MSNTKTKPCRSCYREGCGCDFIDGECCSTDKPKYAPSSSVILKENISLKKTVQELEQKIDKMRNCWNCSIGHTLTCPVDCKGFDQWELK